jgi:hypothetical protein
MRKFVPSILALVLLLSPLSSFAGNQVTTTTPIWIAFVTGSLSDPKGQVPALNKVPGAGVTNLDIGIPVTIFNHGTSYVYVTALEDLNFNGTCQASFKLTQVQGGATVTLDSGTDPTFACTPSSSWAWAFFGKAIPNSPGLAKLTATVKYGTKTVSFSSTVLLQ